MTDAGVSTDTASAELVIDAAPGAQSVSTGLEETEDTRSARQKIVDHLDDTEGPQHVSAIVQGTGLDRRVIDPILSRGVKSGLFVRVAEATYELAPEPDRAPLPPAPQDVPRADGIPDSEWVRHLWTWHRTGRWEGVGAAPGREDGIMVPGCMVSLESWAVWQGELAAVLQLEAEDDALRDRLIRAAAGNVMMRAPGLLDMRPIRIALAHAGIDVDLIRHVIAYHHDRRTRPSNPPLSSWADLLPHIASWYGRHLYGKELARKWAAKLADVSASTDRSPVLRHTLAGIAPQEAAGEPDALAAGVEPPTSADAPSTIPDDVPAAPGVAPAADPMAGARSGLLARFRRSADATPAAAPAVLVQPPSRTMPEDRDALAANLRQRRQADGAQPVTSEPQANRPWFAPQQQPHEEIPGMSADAIDELVQAWRVGNIAWPSRILGEHPPGHPQCRLSRETLRRNRLL